MIRKVAISLFIILLWSCRPYEKIYIPITEYDDIERLNRINQKNISEHEAYLTFTKNFDKEQIKILEDGQLTVDSVMSTGSRGIEGVANSFKINKNAIITVKFKNCHKLLTILPKDMKDYKFIYIEKKDNYSYIVEFNNSKIFYTK
jgi:hypothetical protein